MCSTSHQDVLVNENLEVTKKRNPIPTYLSANSQMFFLV